MEYAVHIAVLLPYPVKHGADRIGHTARQQEQKAFKRDRFKQRFHRKHDAPAHAEIADHREFGVLFEVDRRKDRRKRRHAPHYTEEHPCRCGGNLADGREQNRRIRAGDQKVNCAVVDDLQHLFRRGRTQGMIHARHRVECDKRHTVDRAADNAPDAMMPRTRDNAGEERKNAECRTHNVRYVVENLLSLRVGREDAVGKLGSFHFVSFRHKKQREIRFRKETHPPNVFL